MQNAILLKHYYGITTGHFAVSEQKKMHLHKHNCSAPVGRSLPVRIAVYLLYLQNFPNGWNDLYELVLSLPMLRLVIARHPVSVVDLAVSPTLSDIQTKVAQVLTGPRSSQASSETSVRPGLT